jgi:hypothetical protein
MTWIAVVVCAVGCYAFKIAGLSLPARTLDHRLVQRIGDLIPLALLGALIAVQVFAHGARLVVDARLAGACGRRRRTPDPSTFPRCRRGSRADRCAPPNDLVRSASKLGNVAHRQDVLETDGQTRVSRYPSDRREQARHERGPIHAGVPDRQGLPR